ncbi:IS3 family transposase [Clostridium sp. JS66]|uniref:IS3 family transposase n=1 Tax=Clostridium sp. JS66 TaxID=3064705 RepID=UPI00298DE858|nr:IS3 family transposase [Clostridium sp. JS66]WPC44853.1 IS3 family transposase [Clostridium sp. JS66]
MKQINCLITVKRVSAKGITYTDEFKRIFISEDGKGKFPRLIFEECGFDINILGKKRIEMAAYRWRTAYNKEGVLGLQDTRKDNSGRPRDTELSIEEKYERLKAQISLLKAENELLKKLDMLERDDEKEISLPAEQKFNLIKLVITKHKLKNLISYLCKIVGVSRSGYYNYFSSKSHRARNKRTGKDEMSRDIILKAYNFKGRKKGAKQIKMTLEGEFGIVYNLKRIRRIMIKYGIICPIRKANPYRRIMKATKEHTTLPNLLNRNFKQNTPGKVLLTDITYLFYGNGKKAYLSTIKDGSTNEILSYNLSDKLTLDIATDTIDKLINEGQVKLTIDAFIHSDQGAHYTSPKFQSLVKGYRLGQSMSRRGNCWNNAPQESFFGHFKDESYIKSCETLSELKEEIENYMFYYNNYRYQWGLKKMTPVQYRNHLLNLK